MSSKEAMEKVMVTPLGEHAKVSKAAYTIADKAWYHYYENLYGSSSLAAQRINEVMTEARPSILMFAFLIDERMKPVIEAVEDSLPVMSYGDTDDEVTKEITNVLKDWQVKGN